MPCDTITTTTVQSELVNRNIKLLKLALEAMGFTVNEKDGFLTFFGRYEGQYHSGIYQNGKLSEQVKIGRSPIDINAIKRSYAAQIIQKGFPGWNLTKTTAKEKGQLQ